MSVYQNDKRKGDKEITNKLCVGGGGGGISWSVGGDTVVWSRMSPLAGQLRGYCSLD